MKDREIDAILSQAAQAPHEVDPALLDRIARSIGRSLGPVRPLPPAWAPGGRADSDLRGRRAGRRGPPRASTAFAS